MESAPQQGTADVEEAILGQLAAIGLVVPVRDPNRPHTLTEQRCWKWGVVGVRKGQRGGAYKGRRPCKSWGCSGCAEWQAGNELTNVRASQGDFVGIHHISKENLAYMANADKRTGDGLWVTTVPTPPENTSKLRERIGTRRRRLMTTKGVPAECVVVPCDGMTVIVADADLAEDQPKGRPKVAPTTGFWLPVAVALLFLERTLASAAVRGQIRWTDAWQPEKPEPKSIAISGTPLVTDTAWKILWSEGYEYNPDATGWDLPWDPKDVLLEAKRRAEEFWADPRCGDCEVLIAPDDKHWWRDGEARCGICDLAFDLSGFLVKGRTEREIEVEVRIRKLTFKRNRALIEAALARAGAKRQPNGIWAKNLREEDAA